jgi:hypothetical protein
VGNATRHRATVVRLAARTRRRIAAAVCVTGQTEGPARRAVRFSVVYFSALGFGFISVELSLLQHLTLLVGHPIFTLSVLLFTLLAAGGIGSSISGRVPARLACVGVAILGVAESFVLPRIVPALLPWSLSARVAVAMCFIAPLGVLMGIPFPSGLRRSGQGALQAPPFYWGLNGILSVIGSVTTVFVAMLFGFQAAMLVGCGCYLIAAVTAIR